MSRTTALPSSTVFGVRLRQARERVGISQEALATSAGIDEFSASARISQYETGKHVPRYEIACKLAEVLAVPVAFLYARDNATAQLLLLWQAAPAAARQRAITALE
ncbi:XRE family transcriptional regulator [Pelomonas saccharophila]|nr:XRE family transcriptional regulator [Roseateles saccharophilus]